MCGAIAVNALSVPGDDFKNSLEKMYSSMQKNIREMELTFAEQYGFAIKLQADYSRANNQIINTFEVFSEDVYNMFDVEVLSKNGVDGFINLLKGQDSTGNTLKWFISGMYRTNTSIAYVIKYHDKQKKKVISAFELLQIYMVTVHKK